MMPTSTMSSAGTQAAFEFDELEAMPCGCVAARYRVLSWAGHVSRLEAKGPYCPFDSHETGCIVGLGMRSDILSSDDALDMALGRLP